MPRHVALLRGVTPTNLRMADLKASLELAGFENVRTAISSGNVAFDSDEINLGALGERIEAMLSKHVGRSFPAIVRSTLALNTLLQGDPFAGYGLPESAKRVVSFLRLPREPRVPLPFTEGTATVIHQVGSEVFTAYLPSPDGPVFMKLIERAYGADITTRTWETIRKCAAA